MHLFSLLSNFEPPQLTSVLDTGADTVQTASTRADLQSRSDKLHAELVTRYVAGVTVKALAAKHGMHHQTVRALLVTAGASIRTRQRRTPAELDEMARLYESGLTTTEIGERFGMYASTVGTSAEEGWS